MTKKNWLLSVVFMALVTVLMAQPGTEQPVVEGDDGAAEAAIRAEFLNKIHNYNAQVNLAIAKKQYFHHHLDLNRSNQKFVKSGVVVQSLDCFFAFKNNEYVPVKIMILSTTGAIQSHTDFLFDDNGDVTYCAYNSDISNENSNREAFYYISKQLQYYSKDGLVLPKKEYGTDVFQKGVEVLNRAEDYKLMLSTIFRIQPN